MCLADYDVARGIAGERLRTMLRERRPTPELPPPRMLWRHATVAIVLLIVVLIGGCGDDESTGQTTAPALNEASSSETPAGSPGPAADSEDEPSADPATDQEKIRTTLEGVLAGGDPGEICGELVTEHYLEQAYGSTASCKKAQAPKARADKLQIGDISISPEAVASTSIKVRGGVYDKERLRAELVLKDGMWQLDSLRSNVPVGP